MDDPLDLGAQPRCANCGVTMRDHPRGYVCPECGGVADISDEMSKIEMPPDFDGPSIHGG